MKKILIVSYYQLKESLLCAANALRNTFKYDICNYPLFQYAFDKNDKRPDYLQHFLEYIAESECDIILWWFFGLSAQEIQYIREKTADKMHVLYNWDDPHCWQLQHGEHGNKCRNFDLVLCSSSEKSSFDLYCANGVKRVIYALPGYAPEIFHPIIPHPGYIADVSFCITNLYESNAPNQFINRKKLVDMLSKASEANLFTFHLYGPEYLRDLYPKCYKGYAQYNELNQIFNQSRINISTHVVCNASGYINERTIQILASGGGKLLVDRVKDFPFSSGGAGISIIDPADPIGQIKGMLTSSAACDVNEMQYRYVELEDWTGWAAKLHQEFARHFFNWRFYKETYNLASLDRDAAWEHWQENWRTNLYDRLPPIPQKFNITKYREDMGVEGESVSDELVYWHWKTEGKEDMKYLVKHRNKNHHKTECNIALIPEEEHRLLYLFSQLANENAAAALQEIDSIVSSSPYLNLKSCLDKYFE